MEIAHSKRRAAQRPVRPYEPEADTSAFYSCRAPGVPALELHLNVVDEIAREIVGSPGRWSDTTGVLLGRRKESADSLIVIEDCAPLHRGAPDASLALEQLLERWRPGHGRRLEPVGFYKSAVSGAPSVSARDAELFDSCFPEASAVFLFIYASRGRLVATFLSREAGRLASPAERPAFLFSRRDLAAAPRGGFKAGYEPDETDGDFTEDIERDRSRLPGTERRPLIGTKAALAIGGVVAAGLVGIGALEFRALPVQESSGPVAAAPAQDGAWLNLRVERLGSEWQLRWNRDAAILRESSRGRLQIVDGAYRKDLLLDGGDLRSGYMAYAPMTDEVSFRLEVFDAAHQRTLGESVRAAGSLQAVGPRDAANAADPYSTPDTLLSAVRELMRAPSPNRAARETSPSSDDADPDRSGETEPSPGARPMRSAFAQTPVFTPPSIGHDVFIARENTPDPPPANPPALDQQAAYGTDPLARFIPLMPPAAPAAPPAVPQTSAAPPAPEKAVGAAAPRPQLSAADAPTPAVLVRRVEPEYPLAARQARVSGVVRLAATVGADGRTSDIRFESGPLMLRNAAIAAARQFVYRPAMLHGKPIDAPATIELRFSLNESR